MLEWYSGLNNYRKHTLEFGTTNKFTVELLDVQLENVSTIQDAFRLHVDGANLPVEVLYSGGLDSECVLSTLLTLNIPIVAVTQRLLVNNAPTNINDLYYSEKFCRENQIKQIIVDFHVDKFYNNGDHIPYMEPYRFTRFPAAALLWLMEQCNSFPVVGGDYSWPQTNIGKKAFSPHRHDYNCYDHYMKSKGITGIGNMLSHSLDSNYIFIKEHESIKLSDVADKNVLLQNLGFNLEYRHGSYGWENIGNFTRWFDWKIIVQDLYDRFGHTISTIKWNHTLADLIGGEPGENDIF